MKYFILFLKSFAGFFLLFGLLEGLLALSYQFQIYPNFLETGFKRFYIDWDRNIIQFDPSCSQYDSSLTYTLKPGTCTFSNVEYANKYFVNTLGTRDNELSLKKPKIVVLGDSFAMGWGVDQHDTFAQRLERKLEVPVLNASVSSYGTVREMMLLQRIDLSNVEYLILQYCENDLEENKTFFDSNNTLKIKTREEFEKVATQHRSQKKYFPGKYVFKLLPPAIRTLWQGKTESSRKTEEKQKEVDYFLNSLKQANLPSKKIKIIFFEISNDTFLTDTLLALKKKKQFPSLLENFIPVPVMPSLKNQMFYKYDAHITAQGHQQIFKILLKTIRESNFHQGKS